MLKAIEKVFEAIEKGWDIVKDSIRIFNRYPKLLIPLIISWLIYASIVVYLKYGFNWQMLSFGQFFLFVLGIIFIFAFLLSFSCSVLLELIQQLELGQEINLGRAFSYTLKYNLLKISPLVFIWTVIWFILFFSQTIFSLTEETEEESFTLENVAKTLASYTAFSFLRMFFEILKKGIRMIIFLILPAIVWEDLSFGRAIKKGITVLKKCFSEFTTGFVFTWFAAGVIFLPPTILFYISDNLELIIPDLIWIIAIIYIVFAWSYSIYLEQMFAAGLYLWYLKWEKQTEKEKKSSKPLSKLRDIKKPLFLDKTLSFSKNQ